MCVAIACLAGVGKASACDQLQFQAFNGCGAQAFYGGGQQLFFARQQFGFHDQFAFRQPFAFRQRVVVAPFALRQRFVNPYRQAFIAPRLRFAVRAPFRVVAPRVRLFAY